MKIAVFHNLPPGGGKRVLYEEVNVLFKKHRLFLFELDSTDENFLDIRPFFEKVYRFHFKIRSNLPSLIARLEKDYQNFILLSRLHKKIAHKIDEGGFDICLVHPDEFTQAPFVLKYLETPSIYFCEELLRIAYEKELQFKEQVFLLKKWHEQVTRILRKTIDRGSARLSSKILTSSFYMKMKIKEAYQLDADVCGLGVDPDTFRPADQNKRSQVLFVGRNDESSGFVLFEKLKALVNASYKTKFKQVSFSDNFTDNDLSKEYSKSILSLCIGRNEPFGLVPLESMSCETPVLAVNEGGYRETVVEGKTGFLLKRDPEKFAEKILFLIKNPRVARRMGKEGRKRILKQWTWGAHGNCLDGYLNNIFKGERQSFYGQKRG